MESIFKRYEMTGVEEPTTDRGFQDILVQGFKDEYDAAKCQICRRGVLR